MSAWTVLEGDCIEVVTCACGCGEPVGADSRGRPRRYAARGHNLRAIDNFMAKPGVVNPFAGRQHTEQTRRVLSEKASVPKPWIRGELNGMSGRTGSTNPNYRDGSSPERQRLYAGAEWMAVARLVRERDGHHCVRCGAEKRGRASLHLHHLKPWAGNPEGRFDPANIATLCRDCHIDAHRKGGGSYQLGDS